MLDRGELEGRFDPIYYTENLTKILSNSPYDIKTIKEVIVYAKSGFASGKLDQSDEKGIIQIRPTNMDEHGLLRFDKNIYVPKELLASKETIQKQEVLFNNTNSQELVGKTVYFDLNGEYFCSNHITRIMTKDIIEPKYLWILFNLYQKHNVFYNSCTNWNNQSGINAELLKSYKIPVPSKSIQYQIISIMDIAHASKKAKEDQAKALLDGIDDYLLESLGITLPEEPRKDTGPVTFEVRFDQVFGNRFDPLSFQNDILRLLNTSKYDSALLNHLILRFKTGFAAGKGDQCQDGIIQIRPTNISDRREFIFDRNVYICPENEEDRQGDLLEKGEVLFNNTNSQKLVGKSIFFDLENAFFCSNHITRLSVDPHQLDPQYLTHIFNLYQRKNVFFNLCVNWNNQSGINIEELRNLKIPLPPLKIQNRLAAEINRRGDKAKRLMNEAKEELETAKKTVEKIILEGADESFN